MQYIKRQHAKKLASGVSQEDLDAMLKFPEPIAPAPAVTPTGELNASGLCVVANGLCSAFEEFTSPVSIGVREARSAGLSIGVLLWRP